MILVDHSEPDEIVKLLQQSAPVEVANLNQNKRSDYFFDVPIYRIRQFSRKQAGELLSNIDEAESQLRDYYNNADENYQIVEGIISSIPLTKKNRSLEAISIRRQAKPNTLFSYKVTESGFIYDEHAWNVSSSMLYAWLFQLSQAGITTYYTNNYIETAKLLASIYRNCQKVEHSTLQRYIIPRIQLKEHDSFIEALMSLSLAYKLNIGEEKATRIAERYSSLFDVVFAEVDELCEISGIGKKLAENLLRSLGRDL